MACFSKLLFPVLMVCAIVMTSHSLLGKNYRSFCVWWQLYWGRFTGPRREQLYSKHVHFQLKEVEVHGFLGDSNEMELAIYLLNNAVSLERMILSPQRRLYHGGGKWTSSMCYSFRWEPKQAYDLLIKEKVNSHTKLIVS